MNSKKRRSLEAGTSRKPRETSGPKCAPTTVSLLRLFVEVFTLVLEFPPGTTELSEGSCHLDAPKTVAELMNPVPSSADAMFAQYFS